MDGNYNNLLNRLSSMSEKISDLYSATLEMEDDSGNAKAIHDYFIKRVADVTGIYESFVNQPDKYIHFVRLDKFLSEKDGIPPNLSMLNSNLLLGVMVYLNLVRCIMTRLSKGIINTYLNIRIIHNQRNLK